MVVRLYEAAEIMLLLVNKRIGIPGRRYPGFRAGYTASAKTRNSKALVSVRFSNFKQIH